MKRIFYIFMFSVVFLFFWGTRVVNRTEAEDAFEYAYQVEVHSHEWMYHPHHLMYGVLMRNGFRLVQALGYSGRAHTFLSLVSALCAAGAVFLFWRFCYRRFSMRPVSSLFAAALLAVSYGFWRYASEAEVILPAGVVVLYAAYLSTSPKHLRGQVIYAGVISGISVLFHVLNGVAVFLALPLFYVLKREWRNASLHIICAGGVVLAAYSLIYTYASDQVFVELMPSAGERLDWAFMLKGLIGFGQCLVSGNFLFGIDTFSEKMVALFPYRMLAEEIYMGKHMSWWQSIIPIFTLLLLCFSFFLGLWRAGRSWKRAYQADRVKALHMVGGWQTVFVVGLWFGVYALAILFLEPGNPEVWVLGLIPFWLLVCGLIIGPIARSNELWVVLLIVVTLGLHNYAGGLSILSEPVSDYNRAKAEPVLMRCSDADVILTGENPVFVRYLRYYSPATVVDLNEENEQFVKATLCDAGRVFVLNDVFDYPPSMRVRFPGYYEKVRQYALMFEGHTERLWSDEFGGGWILDTHELF